MLKIVVTEDDVIYDITSEKFEEILDKDFWANDIDCATTVRQYLRDLLNGLFTRGEGFNGKRPLGDSGWMHNFAEPLIQCGVLVGTYEEEEEDEGSYGEALGYDKHDVNNIMLEVIDYVFQAYDREPEEEPETEVDPDIG